LAPATPSPREAVPASAPTRDSQDLDQARAAGVLIELEHSTPIVVDRPLYRELAKRAIMRTVEELREQAERAKPPPASAPPSPKTRSKTHAVCTAAAGASSPSRRTERTSTSAGR
jgi:hypothetical protein